MAEQVKLSYDFPRFFEAVADAGLKPEVRTSFRNLIREIEKMQVEMNRVVNLDIGDNDWIAPTLLNSWVDFGGSAATASYMKVGQDLVLLKGTVKDGTIGANPIFTLPVNYRPVADVTFSIASNNAFGQVVIRVDGDVEPSVGSNTSFSLDGIIFRADV